MPSHHRRITRRALFASSLFLVVACAGGPASRLKTLGTPSGDGPIQFEVDNGSDTIVNNLFLAKSANVDRAGRKAFENESPEQAALWGKDQLVKSALEVGGKVQVPVAEPGSYDVRAVARDGREQHVGRLGLRAGGHYVLELGEGGWRPAQ
jgi:hypothetical protein